MSVIDFSILEQFCELLGEDGKSESCELINLYLTDGLAQIALMEESLKKQDAETFRRAAHTFKSSSANVGAFDLQALCQSMETQAVSGDITPLKDPLTLAIEQFDQVKNELQQWAAN